MCGMKQLFYSFLQFLCHLFFSPPYSHEHLHPKLVQQLSIPKKILEEQFFLGNICWAFLVKKMKYMLIAFLCVHRTQVLLFNFIENSFCYFSISNLNSERPTTSIIFKNVQKCLPNCLF